MAKFTWTYGNVARPWPEIRKFYAELRGKHVAPLKSLIFQIADSPYPAAGLHGLTSMADLLLGPQPAVMDEPHLRIHYDIDQANFLMVYPSPGIDSTQGATWVRRVKVDDAFAVLERFLVKRVRWFRDHRGSRPAK